MSISSESNSLRKQIGSNLQTQSQIIELNVGGEIFTTTLSTLKKHPGSKLAEMFASGQTKPRTDPEGRYFIDRPGTYFKYILEYLRSNQVPTNCVQEVYKEALFYDIEPLVKQLEDSPQIFGELVARKQFLARVPSYNENIELMIRIARAEAVAARQSSVMVCVMKTDEDVVKCHDTLNGLDSYKKSVVKFGPWKASPGISDLLDCIKIDVEAKGYKISLQGYVPEKGFRFKSNDYFYKFLFTWW
ncbi:BTB/POZ domain-containing protein KCTD14 [Podarcis raffonei]|uniref:POZ domain-containing KCTD14 n=1 Tax=Podarcis lilfordi TaxID=74358 RepID=A0AA35P5Z7_9SAUR|nr:BTB/POZ domain-containing protein KCTD14 [Podarcis raffonei]CAI5773498.1 POZ domain-containing KCTD14 [Podarcis lilfordi]